MDLRALLFDINSTLIDIETDERMEECYRAIAHLLTYQGIDLRRWAVRDLYFQVMGEQFAQSLEPYPEFDVVAVWRDVLSRIIVGSRAIMLVASLSTLLGTVLGTSIGLVQGYFLGAVDSFVGRFVEAVLALPVVIVVFLFVVALGPSAPVLIVVIGLVFGLLIARTVRTAVLQERELDYIAAARLRDESNVHIMFVEILPNVFGPILVEFTVRLGYAIFTVATLSFLGFGIQPPTPDWGADIATAEGQPLGLPLQFGGPWAGLMACKAEYVRQLPGREGKAQRRQGIAWRIGAPGGNGLRSPN